MSKYKLKDPPNTFYICDRQRDCKNSERCGKECIHTIDISHAAYKSHNKFKKYVGGDSWEKPIDKAKNTKVSDNDISGGK